RHGLRQPRGGRACLRRRDRSRRRNRRGVHGRAPGERRMSRPVHVIGVDVGGTFTDVFVLDESTGKVTTAKVPSTRGDQSRGFVEGIAGRVGDFSTIATIVHGTTVGTNALLERKGARTGIITTEGFR